MNKDEQTERLLAIHERCGSCRFYGGDRWREASPCCNHHGAQDVSAGGGTHYNIFAMSVAARVAAGVPWAGDWTGLSRAYQLAIVGWSDTAAAGPCVLYERGVQ